MISLLWERDILMYYVNWKEKYNLSLDVVDPLSTASSFDTHTFAHQA
jgi:hypothetical protein